MSKAKKWSQGQIGSVISATLREADLIPAFCEELRYLGHRSKTLTQIEKDSRKEDYFNDYDACTLDIESLVEMLNEHALPYFYFGSYRGDGSDFGFWLSEDFEFDYGGLKVDDLADVPSNYVGEVLEVNDHGNTTLYWKNRRGFRELWSVV